jgi:hypothetical protein
MKISVPIIISLLFVLSSASAGEKNDVIHLGILSSEEKAIINSYYRGDQPQDTKGKKKKRLPPGLQKKVARGGELPPGWQKKVARGEVLDVEVHANSEQLPLGVIEKLPSQPEGTEIIRVEGKIIRLIKATRTILDAFDLNL